MSPYLIPQKNPYSHGEVGENPNVGFYLIAEERERVSLKRVKLKLI